MHAYFPADHVFISEYGMSKKAGVFPTRLFCASLLGGRCPTQCAARLGAVFLPARMPPSLPNPTSPSAAGGEAGPGPAPPGRPFSARGRAAAPAPPTGTGPSPPSSGPAAAGAGFLASLIAAGPCDWLRGSDPARAPGWADKRGLSRGLPGIPGAGTRDRRPQHDGQSGRGAGPQPAR